MTKISVLNNPFFNDEAIFENGAGWAPFTRDKQGFRPVNYSLADEGGRDFNSYLERLNMSAESNLLILNPGQHYFYDESDLRCVGTLVNTKKLNFINDLDSLLSTLCRIMPVNANFIGCFSDNRSGDSNGFLSDLLTRLNRFVDPWAGHSFDRRYVSELLKNYGFKIVDITDINGVTYFCSFKVCQAA